MKESNPVKFPNINNNNNTNNINKTRRKKKFSSKNKTFFDMEKFDPSGQKTAFIGGIPVTCNKNDVLNVLFNAINRNKVQRFELIGKRNNNLNKGFGFATMADEESLKSICNMKISLNGKSLDIRPAKPVKNEDSNHKLHSKRLILKNLSPVFNDEDLKNFLIKNKIKTTTSYLIKDFRTGSSKNIAIVDLVSNNTLTKLLERNSIMYQNELIIIEKYEKSKRIRTQNAKNKNNLSEEVNSDQKKIKADGFDFDKIIETKPKSAEIFNDEKMKQFELKSKSANDLFKVDFIQSPLNESNHLAFETKIIEKKNKTPVFIKPVELNHDIGNLRFIWYTKQK